MHNPGAARRGIVKSYLEHRHCEEHLRRLVRRSPPSEGGSNPSIRYAARWNCFAEPVIGRAFARPVGSQ
jgi:hypothetical protein